MNMIFLLIIAGVVWFLVGEPGIPFWVFGVILLVSVVGFAWLAGVVGRFLEEGWGK